MDLTMDCLSVSCLPVLEIPNEEEEGRPLQKLASESRPNWGVDGGRRDSLSVNGGRTLGLIVGMITRNGGYGYGYGGNGGFSESRLKFGLLGFSALHFEFRIFFC